MRYPARRKASGPERMVLWVSPRKMESVWGMPSGVSRSIQAVRTTTGDGTPFSLNASFKGVPLYWKYRPVRKSNGRYIHTERIPTHQKPRGGLIVGWYRGQHPARNTARRASRRTTKRFGHEIRVRSTGKCGTGITTAFVVTRAGKI